MKLFWKYYAWAEANPKTDILIWVLTSVAFGVLGTLLSIYTSVANR